VGGVAAGEGRRAVTVLLTGFEPFDGQAVNASWLTVDAVLGVWDGHPIEAVVLPVSFARAPDVLRGALDRRCPDLVVCLGETGELAEVAIERVAVNRARARIPDNDGAQPVDEPLVPGGPDTYLSTLPLHACLSAASSAGVPVRISESAGTFVCNAVFYAAARALSGTGIPYGFVHVPRVQGQVAEGALSLPTASSARAVTATLRAALAS